jgi:enterochelin esterase-like enzyme
MSLTGTPLLMLAVLAAVISPALTAVLWSRVRGVPTVQLLQRLSLVLLCQVSAVLMTALLVNNEFSLYDSWSDLFGQNPVAATGPLPDAAGGTGNTMGSGESAGGSGHFGTSAQPVDIPGLGPLPAPDRTGRVVQEEVVGPKSRIKAKIWVLLPAGYNDPANASRRYPVIEFLPGYPGTPTTWLHAMELQKVSDAEVAAGRVKPFIGVLPTMNVAMPRDTECTDIPKGLHVASWLGSDVPRIVAQQARTLPMGQGWGITGYSTGGFCTAKLTLLFPGTFHAGAVLAGYYNAGSDTTTGDIFGNSQAIRQANDPIWLVSHRPAPAVHMLAIYSTQDPSTNVPTQRFLAAARPPLQVEQIRLTEGGHNIGVWLSVEPQVLAWLSRYLS